LARIGSPITTNDRDLTAALKLLDACFEAFNSADADKRAGLNNYPHVRITGATVKIWHTREEYARDTSRAKLLSKGKTTSFKGWETTVWLTRNLIQRSEETMHFAVTFTRQDAQGQEIAIFEALWILTKDNGRWGVQARSSFAGIADGGAY